MGTSEVGAIIAPFVALMYYVDLDRTELPEHR
jgi:hypothetical protein